MKLFIKNVLCFVNEHMQKYLISLSIKKAGTLFTCLLFVCIMESCSNGKIGENETYGSLPIVQGAVGYSLFAVPVVLLYGYRVISDYLVSHKDSTGARDNYTGVLYGAAQYNIGNVDSGGAVLMVHGFLGAGNNFNDLPERLAGLGWYVRVMRLPGHGTSPRDLEHVTADILIQSVLTELEDLQRTHDRVVLLGHSMGGTLCTIIVSQHAVDRLILCAPYFGVTYKKYYILKPETWTDISQPILRWVYKGDSFLKVNRSDVKDRIVSYSWVPLRGIKTLHELGQRASSPEVLNSITCPVLLIHSQGDEASSPERSREVFDAIKSTEKHSVWLKTSNHHIFWDFESDEVMSEIERYLGQPPEKNKSAVVNNNKFQ